MASVLTVVLAELLERSLLSVFGHKEDPSYISHGP